MNQHTPRNLFLAAILIALWHTSSVMAQAQEVKLTIIQPDATEHEVILDAETTVDLLADGNLQVRAMESLSCGTECAIEFDYFTATSQGETVSAGQSISIEQGDSIRFDWSVRGGWSCFADGLPGSGNWEGGIEKAYRTYGDTVQDDSVVATSNVAVSADAYPASLTCTQGGKEVSEIIYTTVTEPTDTTPPPNEEFCADRPSLSEETSLVRTRDVLMNNSEEDGFIYSGVFGWEFPGFNSPQKDFRLEPGSYASIQFTTPSDLSGAGKWTFNELTGTAGGSRLVAISPCEGDFRPQDLPSHCVLHRTTDQQFRWTTSPDDQANGCLIEPNKTYFLNIIYSEDQPGTWPVGWDCPSANRCGHSVTPIADMIY